MSGLMEWFGSSPNWVPTMCLNRPLLPHRPFSGRSLEPGHSAVEAIQATGVIFTPTQETGHYLIEFLKCSADVVPGGSGQAA